MKKFTYIFSVAIGLSMLAGCVSGGENTGVEYAPDMYVSKGYEPYSQLENRERYVEFQGQKYIINKDGKSMREPVAGTIAQGKLDLYFPYAANDQEAKIKAGADLKNPVELNQVSLEAGRRLYNINCLPCHGEKGLGDGLVGAKYPPSYVPSYKNDRPRNTTALADGSIYYVITHGWNLMGAYGKTLNPTERWQVVHYVNYLEKN